MPGLGDQALLIRISQVNGPLPDGSYVAAPDVPGRSPARAVRTVLARLVSALNRLAQKK